MPVLKCEWPDLTDHDCDEAATEVRFRKGRGYKLCSTHAAEYDKDHGNG